LVGLPKNPLLAYVLPTSAFPWASYRQPRLPNPVPPELAHVTPAGGVSPSTNGRNRVPQAPLLAKVLFITVSFWPPEMVIPVPTGPAPA
jgi:hypothetical protein